MVELAITPLKYVIGHLYTYVHTRELSHTKEQLVLASLAIFVVGYKALQCIRALHTVAELIVSAINNWRTHCMSCKLFYRPWWSFPIHSVWRMRRS